MRCKECGCEEWYFVVPYLKEELGTWLHLYQCKQCKRVVLASDDDLTSNINI